MNTEKKIKSVQFEDSYFPVIDGVVKVVHNYAKLMNETSYSCVVCPKTGSDFDDGKLPYDIFRTPSFHSKKWQYSLAIPGAIKGCKRLIDDIKPDILHVHSPFMQRTCAIKIARRLDIPIVATFHTKYYDDILQVFKSRLFAKYVISNIVRFYNKCDSVWACSEGTAKTLSEYGYKGNIKVMPNGTNYKRPSNTAKITEEVRKKFNINKKKRNLLFIGSQVWQKNIKLILDTFKLLCIEKDDICLWMVGDGRNREAIKKYARDIGLTDEQVIFTGKVDDENTIAGLFLNADLFFFPSVYDNSPIVLREASVLETPSLLAKGSTAADVIIPEDNGFVAEENKEAMAEKILQVIYDEELLKKTGKRAAETIPVPWEKIVPKVYEEYGKIIEEHKRKIRR